MPLADYWVSEKYDGVRGYWDGQQLWTRGGERIVAPAWFTADLPTQPLDGELWAGRGRFKETVSTVRSQTPDDKAWREIRFMVFDLPTEPGDFTAAWRGCAACCRCRMCHGWCRWRSSAPPRTRPCRRCSTRP